MNFLEDFLTVVFFYLIITFLWAIAEKVVYGQITPRKVDDIVAIILAISIYYNLK